MRSDTPINLTFNSIERASDEGGAGSTVARTTLIESHPISSSEPPSIATLSDSDIFDEDSLGAVNTANHESSSGSNDLLELARQYAKDQDFVHAVHYYQLLLKLLPEAIDIQVELADVYLRSGDHAQAQAILSELAQQPSPAIFVLEAYGQALCADGQFDKAEKILLGALTKGVSSVKIYYWLGESLRQQGKLRAAQTTYLMALRLSPQDMMLRLALITLLSESDPSKQSSAQAYQEAMNACLMGQLDKAIEYIKEAVMFSAVNHGEGTTPNPMLDESLESLISAVQLSGDAGPELSEFLNATNSSPEKIILRAKIKWEEGNHDEAGTILEEGLKDYPNNESLIIFRAELLEKESTHSAIDYLSTMVNVLHGGFEALSYLGRLYIAVENYPNALISLRRAYEINPNHADNNQNLITMCRQTNNLGFALQIVNKTIETQGQSPDNLLLLGTLHADMGNLAEAGTFFSMVAEKDSKDVRGVMAQALMYHKNKMFRDAILVLRAHLQSSVIESTPDFLHLYATLLFSDEQFTDTQITLKRLLSLFPDHVPARCIYAETLVKQGDYLEAARQFHMVSKAMRHDIKFLVAWAEVLEWCGEISEAQDLYKEVLEKKPTYPKARQNLGLIRLRQEDFTRGLEAYEVMSATRPPSFPEIGNIPFWRGEPIRGKTLLLYQNFSRSEMILFARFFPYLQKMGAQVHVLAKKDLVEVLMPHVDLCTHLPHGADFTLPMSSVPKIFNLSLARIPLTSQYLTPDLPRQDNFDKRLGPKKKMRVGFAWQSDLPLDFRKPYDKIAGFDLSLFGRLLNDERYDFISFQMGQADQREEGMHAYPIRSTTHMVTSWADVVAGVSLMDAVITNDQPLAHIAGALGVPTIVLLPLTSPWYWFTHREDSPWYQSVSIFRQTILGDWFAPYKKCEALLAQWAGEKNYSSFLPPFKR